MKQPLSLIKIVGVLWGALALSACGSAGQQLPLVSAAAGDALLTSTPTPTEAIPETYMKSRADRLLAEGNFNAALPLYRDLLNQSGTPERRLWLARALLAAGRAADALAVLEDIESNTSLGTAMAKGEGLLAVGQFAAAKTAFDIAISLGGGEDAYAGRGIANTVVGNTEEALSDFKAVSPPRGPSNEALVLIVDGRSGEAITVLEALIRSGKAGPRDRQNLVFAYVAEGREGEARAIAHLDLDRATARQTIGFYRTLAAQQPRDRLNALLVGVVEPGQNRGAAANYVLGDGDSQAEDAHFAGNRVLAAHAVPVEEVMLAEATPIEIAVETGEEISQDFVHTTQTESENSDIINGEDVSDLDPATIPPILERFGWAVQVGAYRSIRRLTRGWTVLRDKNKDLLNTIEPRRSEIEFAEKTKSGKHGFYYRLNAGPLQSLEEARTLCKALRTRNTGCWVRPPEAEEGSISPDEDRDTTPKLAAMRPQ